MQNIQTALAQALLPTANEAIYQLIITYPYSQADINYNMLRGNAYEAQMQLPPPAMLQACFNTAAACLKACRKIERAGNNPYGHLGSSSQNIKYIKAGIGYLQNGQFNNAVNLLAFAPAQILFEILHIPCALTALYPQTHLHGKGDVGIWWQMRQLQCQARTELNGQLFAAAQQAAPTITFSRIANFDTICGAR